MRLGVLTGGGDCPGLNAVIRAVVRREIKDFGGEVFGFHDGWRGVMENRGEELSVLRLRGTLPRGGTILGTSRETPYMVEGGCERVAETMEDRELDGLIVIGGEGTLSCARQINDDGYANVVGVPKTIDNDVGGTERTFGFDTAVSIATEAIDRLHTTAESHDRIMVVEVMGRHVGHIATWAGIAGGATMTLIPEEPFDIVEVCDSLAKRHAAGKYASIVVVAEGARPLPGTLDVPEPEVDRYGHQVLGGISHIVAGEIEERTGFDTRVTILGYIQRGGTPTANDRVLCSRFGVAAVDAAHAGEWNHMVALNANHISSIPLSDAVGRGLKTVPDQLWQTANVFFP
ncbi:MAG: ATP-dependent 6-phosphofructokinase [Actinomycetota bacterium]